MQHPETLGEPDLVGVGQWMAWRRASNKALLPTDVGSWLLYCPGAHLAWSYWMMGAASLADFPGMPPAKIVVPGATHEVMIWSIHPDHVIEIDLFRRGEWLEGEPRPLLSPPDLVHQVRLPSDEVAEHLLEMMAKEIMTGRISPDQDFRVVWAAILDRTAEHMRGEHGAKA